MIVMSARQGELDRPAFRAIIVPYTAAGQRRDDRKGSSVQLLGTVIALQVQISSLKVGESPRRYDPAPLLPVFALTISPGGVVGETGEPDGVIDVHHRDHPASKNRTKNGISLGFTAHYAAMRERFGPHLRDGIAGENMLISTDRRLTAEDLAGGVIIARDDGARLELLPVIVAAPCVEFSRFALRFPDDQKPDRTVTEALRFLDGGMRGFYASYSGEPAVVRVGDRLLLA